jgi:glucose-1-phosphate cytidylyltransferase
MKVVIFAGGRGTRLEEETKGLIPKPMVKIGDIPLLEHIVTIYHSFGFDHFIIAGGFKADIIQEWADRFVGAAIEVVLTGAHTQTGGRLLRLQEAIGNERFMLTYGDGLADINLLALLDFHERMRERSGVSMTVTAVRPPGRWGALQVEGGLARVFVEKSQLVEGWINGGFYVVEPEVFRVISGDQTMLEYDILPSLAVQNRLAAFQHTGWWMGMDNPRDKDALEELWQSNKAPWRRLLK